MAAPHPVSRIPRTGIVVSFAKVDSLENQWAWLAQVVRDYPWVKSLLEQISPLMLSIMTALAPIIFGFLSKREGHAFATQVDASLLNNLGMAHADVGDFPRALVVFEGALAARERIGDAGRTRVARWMIARALRNLGRRDEALAMQRALKAELAALGQTDPYVEEELALLEPPSDAGS